MTTIQIYDLNTTVEYAELSDLELEAVVGGKGSTKIGAKQTNNGPTVTGEASVNSGNHTFTASGSYSANGQYSAGGSYTYKW